MKAALAFVLAAAAVAHGAGLRNGFVYDDHRFVDGNPALQRASVAELLLDPATQTNDADRDVYRPLRTLGHAADARRWGDEPFGFHLHSLLVHLACVAVGYGCVRFLLGGGPALLGATVLAVHPLGVEVVGWISSRGDLYALLFGLLALWAAVAADAGGARRRWLLPAAGALTCLAVLGKESAVWVPLVVAVHAWWLAPTRRRWTAGITGCAAGAAAALLLRQWALSGLSPVQTGPHGGSLLKQAGWALHGAGRTLGHLVWPAGLSIDYPEAAMGRGTAGWWSLPTLVMAAVLVLLVWWRRRRPAAAFALAWLLLAYLPSSSLIVTLRSLLTDRAAYPMLLPAGALLGLLAARASRAATWSGATALVLALTPIAVLRTRDFESDFSLWSAELRAGPGTVETHLGLAAAADDPGLREQHLRLAAHLAPPGTRLEATTLGELGRFLLGQRDDPAVAVPLLQRSLDVQRHTRERNAPGPDEASTAAALAEGLSWMGRDDEAEQVLKLAIAEQPRHALLHIERGILALWRHGHGGGEVDLEIARAALESAHRFAAPDEPRVEALAERLAQAERRAGAEPASR